MTGRHWLISISLVLGQVGVFRRILRSGCRYLGDNTIISVLYSQSTRHYTTRFGGGSSATTSLTDVLDREANHTPFLKKRFTRFGDGSSATTSLTDVLGREAIHTLFLKRNPLIAHINCTALIQGDKAVAENKASTQISLSSFTFEETA